MPGSIESRFPGGRSRLRCLRAGLLLALFLLTAGIPLSRSEAQASSSGVRTVPAAELRTRLEQLNHDIATRGMLAFAGAPDKLLTGYAYGEFFDWDLYFENIYLSYYGISRFDFTNLDVFLKRQQPDGFISRTLGITYPKPRQMFKPFLAQLAVLGSKQRGDYEWLRAEDYDHLRRYIDRWFQYDADHNGLPTWNSSDASGMDNQLSRSGDLDSNFDEGVDLACYLFRELQAMAIVAEKLNKAQDKARFLDRATQLSKRINDVFWDEKDGFYYDRDERAGKMIRGKSVAGFIPLWAGVAPPDRARRLVNDHLLNPAEFWLKYPVATYAHTEGDFYQGTRNGECNWRGSTWIPTNYMIFHGLVRYGFDKVAKELARRTQQMALEQNKATREYYNSETGQGYGMNPFWGWSSLAYLMPLEFDLHYDPTDLTKPVRPIAKERLGLTFAEAVTDRQTHGR